MLGDLAFLGGAVVGYRMGCRTEVAAISAAYIMSKILGSRLLGDHHKTHAVFTFATGAVGSVGCYSIHNAISPKEWTFSSRTVVIFATSYYFLCQCQAFMTYTLVEFLVTSLSPRALMRIVDTYQETRAIAETKTAETTRDARIQEFDTAHPLYCAANPRPEGLTPINEECSICLEPINQNLGHRILPKCRHAFHQGCIDTWIEQRRACPFCTTPMYDAFALDPLTEQ